MRTKDLATFGVSVSLGSGFSHQYPVKLIDPLPILEI
jgi:hypothetical protein